MKVIFNALQTTLAGGIGRYSYELAKELYLNNKDVKIVIREQDLDLFNFVKSTDLIIVKNINNSIDRNIYEQFKLPKLIYKKFPDAIIHYPDSMAPLFAKNKVVITVHDLAFKSLKNIFTWKTVIWKSLITKLSVKKANKIIAISNFTQSEILKHYPKLDRNKISVVYNGFNDFSKDKIHEKNISEKIKSINKKYILTVSTISPRKNIDGLIKAFNEIKDDIDEYLIVAGSKGWMCEEVYKLVNDFKLNDRVIFTGKINDDELKYLYKNAKVFLYLSFYEGFGLPPLEAMSYGIPCIVSNTSSIPEVVGDAAVVVNPHNLDQIAKQIIKILNGKNSMNVCVVEEHLKKFSWKQCSAHVMKIYKQ